MGQMVELECDDNSPVTSDGARRALVYWVKDTINDRTAIDSMRGHLGPAPFQNRTLVQRYLVDTGLYETDLDSIDDPVIRRSLLQSLSATGSKP